MQWYYAINGQRLGPVTEAEFEQLVRSGTISSDTLVWRQGMPNWIPYSQTTESTSAVAPIAGTGTVAEDDSAVCSVSGKRYPKREMVQFEGKWISAEHRDAYFQRLREGGRAPGEMLYAGFWIRLLAKILDGLIIGVVIMIIYAILIFGVFGLSALNPENPDALGPYIMMQFVLVFAQIGLGLLYSWFFLSRYSATPGKMALGLKVVRSDGASLSTGRIIGRFFGEMLSGMILYIGYIIAGFDSEKRALHDHICDTRVIKAK